MGMQKSEELKDIIQVIFEQCVHLNVKVITAGFIMDYKESDDWNIWIANNIGSPSKSKIPSNGPKIDMKYLIHALIKYNASDLHIRVGLSPTFAMSLSGGYLLGIAVGKGMDQITAEVPGGSMKGFHVDLGASVLIADWLAVQATVPVRRYSIALDAPMGAAFMYRGATDMYYGLIAGIAVMTK